VVWRPERGDESSPGLCLSKRLYVPSSTLSGFDICSLLPLFPGPMVQFRAVQSSKLSRRDCKWGMDTSASAGTLAESIASRVEKPGGKRSGMLEGKAQRMSAANESRGVGSHGGTSQESAG